MFKNVQFLFLGKFKGYKHINLKHMVTSSGGSCVCNCSDNTDYIVIPNDLGSGEKYANNHQITVATEKKKPIVHLSFLLDCMNQKKIVPFQEHLVERFKRDTRSDYEEDEDNGGNHTTDFQTNNSLNFSFPKDFRVWKEYEHSDGRCYYYNILSGLTQWEKPLDFNSQSVRTDEELQRQTSMVHQYQQVLHHYQNQYDYMLMQQQQQQQEQHNERRQQPEVGSGQRSGFQVQQAEGTEQVTQNTSNNTGVRHNATGVTYHTVTQRVVNSEQQTNVGSLEEEEKL